MSDPCQCSECKERRTRTTEPEEEKTDERGETEPMKISDAVKLLRESLEGAVTDLLRDFEEDTGLQVKSVNVRRNDSAIIRELHGPLAVISLSCPELGSDGWVTFSLKPYPDPIPDESISPPPETMRDPLTGRR